MWVCFEPFIATRRAFGKTLPCGRHTEGFSAAPGYLTHPPADAGMELRPDSQDGTAPCVDVYMFFHV